MQAHIKAGKAAFPGETSRRPADPKHEESVFGRAYPV